MVGARTGWICVLAAAVSVCSACSRHPAARERNDNSVKQVKVVVANKGPDPLYEFKVRVGEEEFKLGSFGPGIVASRKFVPRPEELGKTVRVAIEYEDEEEKVIRLEGYEAFEVFAKGEIRLEIGNGILLAERVSKE